MYSSVKCVPLDKREEATENQVLQSLRFPSGTGQIDPISFVMKTPAEPLETDIREERIFCRKALLDTGEENATANDSGSVFISSMFEIGEQDRLLKATLAMQYPVSGEQNPFVS